MKGEKMHLVNKIFNNETIRTVWDKEDEKYYISVVDIVGVLTESNNPQIYWRVMKKRLKDEGNETVTNCNGLKLKAKDGKYYKAYKDHEIAAPLVTQLSWSNNLLILSGSKTKEERHFYLQLAVKNKYSKRELDRQISLSYYERYLLLDGKQLESGE